MIKSDRSPRVSVIIPTYNRATLIGDPIESVLKQTYTDWELIVLDDGSTDDTAQVVAQYGDRVRYVYQENAGETAARNAGFAHARGELISFLDSDDCMLPHNLDTLVHLLDEQSDAGIAYGWYYWMDKDGHPAMWEDPKIPGDIPHQLDVPWPGVQGRPSGTVLEGQILPQLALEETMLIGTVLIRRECLEAVSGFDVNVDFQGHWDFFLRVARAGYTFACCRQGVAVIRLHPGNRGRDQKAMLENRLAILDRLFDDPELVVSLSDVRHQAYYQTFLYFALVFYSIGQLEQGTDCLDKAVEYAPLQSRDLIKVSESIAHPYVTDPEVKDPIQSVLSLFEAIHFTPEVRRLRHRVLGQVYAALAFRQHQAGTRGHVWRYALSAVIHDPSWLRNRGLARIALEGFVGPRILDWVRSRRLPDSAELLETASKTTIIFVSPHFDDVVLSCGGMLAHLARRRADILLVTVFTADLPDGMQVPPLAWELHEQWGEKKRPHWMRGSEEKKIAEHLGARYLWLDVLDAMYRYPTMQDWQEQFRSDFDPRTDPIFRVVRDRLLKVIEEHHGATVFAPLGLGYHRDHLIVHEVLEDIERRIPAANQYYYYEDYPYADGADLQQRLEQLPWPARASTIDIAETLEERVRLIEMYPSQLNMLFGGPDNVDKAVRAYATRVGVNGQPRERLWSAR